VWRGELRNRAKDGSIYWVDTTIVPLLDASAKPREYLAIRSDITARKAMEQQLADQAALIQLGHLAAVVAHEVRNPLAGVKGSLQVLRSRVPMGPADMRIFDAMIARLDTLNGKVDDILRFARPRTPVLEAVELAPAMLEARSSAEAATQGGCASITLPATTTVVRADREMLRSVLLNLLLNACQSGSRDPIEIRVTHDETMCQIDIADRGSGFGDADPEQLFEAFRTTKTSGTGLGLAIVRRLLSLQGGRVVLQSRDGGGAVARVTIPRAWRAD
jgi:two-component system CheB/CheR fusion protein